jgi:HK97 family phage major capsid protein
MSEKLTELRSQVETKQKEADLLLAKADLTPDELKKAETLAADITEICRLIDDHNATAKKASDLRASLGNSRTYLSEPARTLPFGGSPDDRSKGFSADRDPGEYRPADPDPYGVKARLDRSVIDRHPELKNYATPRGGVTNEVDRLADNGGFKSLGHFAYSMIRMKRDGSGSGAAVEQLRKWKAIQPDLAVKEARELDAMGFKAPQGLFEESDPDGGDLIPREFSNNIYVRMLAQNQVLSYLTPYTVMGNTLTVPALKEDSRVDGSRQGGLLAYWEGEADQYIKSKPQFRNVSAKLKKLTVLTYITEELLNDSPIALDQWIGQRIPYEINFKINDAVVNGTGSGMPLGILSSGSKITATAVSGQGASTIVAKNILAMFKRVVWSQRNGMIWLYNQDTEDQLFSLFQPTGSTSGVLFYAPNTDNAGNFRLMNKPALSVEACQSLGTEGDIIAFAPDGYFCITKAGIQSFMSMHLRFDYDEYVYKTRFRFDGQPFDDVALTAFKGSTTYSSIVTLNSTRT